MSELIKRDVVIDALLLEFPQINIPLVQIALERVSVVDAVEVVRCGECEFSRNLDKYEKKLYLDSCVGCTKHSSSYHSVIMEDTDFCSYGERRDGND